MAHYIGIMDCLAHLSSREALSRALPQALAAGKPVVSYDFDGADEIALMAKPVFWFAPATWPPSPTAAPNSPTTRRCGSASVARTTIRPRKFRRR